MTIRFYALTGLLMFVPLTAQAQKKETAPAKALASAEAVKILNRYVEVTGGVAAYSKIKTTQITGQMKIEAQGITGDFTILTKEPGKFLMTQKMASLGEFKAGFDGKTGWANDPLGGFRLLKGKELLDTQLQSDLSATLKWDKLYKKIELKGKEKVGNSLAYKLVMTPKSGNVVTQYYDVASGLLVRTDTISESPQGTFPTQMVFSDYLPVDGVKIPRTIQLKMGPIDASMKILSVKNNLPLSDSTFAPQKSSPGKTK